MGYLTAVALVTIGTLLAARRCAALVGWGS